MAHKLIMGTKILWHTKKYTFCQYDKKPGIFKIHSHQTATVVLAVVIFLFENLREKKSELLTK